MGGRITADGPLAGIGSGGEGGEVGMLTFSGSDLRIACPANGTKLPVSASSIRFSNASVIIETPGDRLFGVNPAQLGGLKLTILFGSATSNLSEPLSKLNATLLQIGRLNPALSGDCTLCVRALSSDSGDRCLAIGSSRVESLIFSIPLRGTHSVTASNATVDFILATPGGVSSFEVDSDRFFIPEGHCKFFGRTPTQAFTPPLLFPFQSRRMLILRFGWFFLWGLGRPHE
jgi:hypothetical protein